MAKYLVDIFFFPKFRTENRLNNMKAFLIGILSTIATLILVICVCLAFGMQNKIFTPVPVYIMSPKDELQINHINSCNIKEKLREVQELKDKGVLLTPQEYTNNVVNYYNTVIVLLVTLLALFSVVSFFHLKFIALEEVKKNVTELLRKSPEIQEILVSNFQGKIDETLPQREEFEELRRQVESLSINDIEDESELEKMKVKK